VVCRLWLHHIGDLCLHHERRGRLVRPGEIERADKAWSWNTGSESLLANILPASIASRLKSSASLIADGYADASVLFADIVGYTEWASQPHLPSWFSS
jgi:class 3 adenylate cyclase